MKTLHVAAACLLGLISLALPIAARAGNGAIKIGVLTDMTGVTADSTGKGSVAAAQMAVDEFGGSALGKPIQVLSADHQHKADIGAAIARNWYDAEGVDVIVDVPDSSVALAIQFLAKERKRIVLFSSAGTTALTNAQCSPYGFHWMFDTYGLAHGTASAVVKSGGTSWFILASDYAFGHQLQKDVTDVVKANGGKVLGAVRHPLNASDFSSFILQAQSSGAKVVGIANAGGDTVNAIKTAQEFGLVRGGQSLAALLVFINDVHSLGLAAMQGTYLTTGAYWDMNDATRAWSKTFKEKTGAMPSMLQIGVYESVLHYLKAVKLAGTDDADKVSAAMRATPINDAFTQDAHIREDGRVIRKMYLAKVKSPSESKYDWDYYQIIRDIPAEAAVWPISESKCPLVKK
jgi:branched-chain amino acid transport system substrate-binding protein